MKVVQIPAHEAEPWLLLRHYARRLPSITYAFGVYRDRELMGVVTYGSPASPHLCRGLCGEEWAGCVIELNRLCCEESPNLASILVGRSLRLLPRPSIVVSYADTGKGHVGYVYQATNFIYTGLTDEGRASPRTDRVSSNGHGRHECRVGTTDKVDTSKGVLIPRAPKHRYVFFCADRKGMKQMRSSLKYPPRPFPKGNTRRHDDSASIEKQIPLL